PAGLAGRRSRSRGARAGHPSGWQRPAPQRWSADLLGPEVRLPEARGLLRGGRRALTPERSPRRSPPPYAAPVPAFLAAGRWEKKQGLFLPALAPKDRAMPLPVQGAPARWEAYSDSPREGPRAGSHKAVSARKG